MTATAVLREARIALGAARVITIAERGLWANMPEGRELQPRYHGEHAVRGAKQHPSDRGRFEYGLSIHFQR